MRDVWVSATHLLQRYSAAEASGCVGGFTGAGVSRLDTEILLYSPALSQLRCNNYLATAGRQCCQVQVAREGWECCKEELLSLFPPCRDSTSLTSLL